jgi:hypothetical protein
MALFNSSHLGAKRPKFQKSQKIILENFGSDFFSSLKNFRDDF